MWNSSLEKPDAERSKKKEKGAAEGEMVRSHHQLNVHEFERTPGDSGRGEPGMLQAMALQRVRHGLATEQQALQRQSLLGLVGRHSPGVWQHSPASCGPRMSKNFHG